MKLDLRTTTGLYDNLPVGIVLFNKDLIVTDFNTTLVKILKSKKELLQNFDIHSLKDKRIIACIKEALKGDNGFYEGPYDATTSGEHLQVCIKTSPIFDNNKNIIGGVGVVEDITERKKHYTFIEDTQKKYYSIFDKSKAVMFITDPVTGHFVDVNESAVKFYGYTKEFMLSSLKISDINISTQWEILEELHNSRKERRGYFLFRHKLASGEIRDVEVYSGPVNIKGKDLLVNIVHDITERKKMEKALNESEERFRDFFERNVAGVFITDTSGNIKACNSTFAKMYEFDSVQHALASNAYSLYLDPRERDRFLDAVRKNKTLMSYESKLKTAKGNTIYITDNAVGVFDEDGKLVELQGFAVDVTKQKLAETEAKRFSHALEHAPASIIITDNDGKILYVNSKFTAVTGYKPGEVIGRETLVLKSGYMPPELYNNMWNTILSGRDWCGEFQNKKKNGELYWVSTSISPLVNNDGDIINFIAIQEDMTEKKAALEAIVKAKEAAETADRLKSEFLAQMSHEVRTPINAILNIAELLKDYIDFEKNSEAEILFRAIKDSNTRLVRTFDLILNMSQIHTGNYKPVFTDEKLYEDLLLPLFDVFNKKAVLKNVVLNIVNNSSAKPVTIDKYSVQQIFSNLIDNAIKFTEHGSVTIQIDEIDNQTHVQIIDTGIGIAEEFLSHIFDAFSQEQHGYSRNFEGTGLGLSLVKKYCEINNASISVESEKGTGTTFKVVF
ncbi:MAG: PAS domain S-box protein [Ignavibacteriales bacterium]|nr:PAS domain S-box protein [Ignavibacteriales bacterium]